jgi:uncharacterized protein YkwD
MHFKRTVSLIIAAVMIVSVFMVTPYSAVEETESTGVTQPTEAVSETVETETSETEAVTEPSSTEEETVPETTAPAETEPATEKKSVKSPTTKLKVKGSTIEQYNKKVLNSVNSYRSSKEINKLKNDVELTEKAYKRAAMLAVNYSKKLSAKKVSGGFPEKYIFAKGATYLNLYKKYKTSDYAKDETVNSCGIANLKVGSERMWVLFLDQKEKTEINKVASYSKKTENYSVQGNYYVKYFKGKNNTGNFKNKSVRYKKNKKYSGQLYLKNYKESVNSYFKVKNLSSQTPVKYSTKDDDIASVTSYGNVKGKSVSAFKERKRYTPKKGDFILFHWYTNDGYLANHVGVVYKVTKNNITTIEGNTKANDYRKSVVSKKVYRNYKRNSQIVGFIDLSQYTSRKEAKKLADLAKKQIGKRGRNYYNHTKAWKKIMGCYAAANWCAIFCGWLMEQKGLDPYDIIRWSPSCTYWIKQCHSRATAKITAKVIGSSKKYSYNITFKV